MSTDQREIEEEKIQQTACPTPHGASKSCWIFQELSVSLQRQLAASSCPVRRHADANPLQTSHTYGAYWDHVLGFWKAALKSPDEVLFFKYEEIKRDPEAHVKKLAEFMGVPISVPEEDNGMVKKIAEFCSFEHLTSLEITKAGAHRFNDRHVI
ncbi:flavonol 3-sulfotransferase-like [Helianthus annuus]|uniref:flavonol 3-sulfotransferase-like n=1 Tax=Helianthus annuus TaxID=4232 RepID=UPI000B8EF580|nr:flavonol 3-sulfotransferase-like [Helianthus annuus]